MAEVKNLENNWDEKKWNKFVEKSKKEFVKAFIVVEALNSRLFKFLETRDHMIFASIILETNGQKVFSQNWQHVCERYSVSQNSN